MDTKNYRKDMFIFWQDEEIREMKEEEKKIHWSSITFPLGTCTTPEERTQWAASNIVLKGSVWTSDNIARAV